MLRIYEVALEMVREVSALADEVAQRDRDLAKQLRRACMSCVLNIAERSGSRDGRRRTRYEDALGSSREALAGLEVAEAAGYITSIDSSVRQRFSHIHGTLVKVIYR